MDKTNRTKIAHFAQSLLDAWGPDRAASALSKTPGELNQIADKHDFNDKYDSILASFGIELDELGTRSAYLKINQHMLNVVLKENQVSLGEHSFKDLLDDDHIMTVREVQRRLLQAGIDRQPTLGGFKVTG